MSGKNKGKQNNRTRAKIYPRRPTPPPATTSAGVGDAEATAVFAGGGLFDSSVKDDISQVFSTILFSENSPVLQREEVIEPNLIGKREDSSVLFSLERLANPGEKGSGAKPPIDPISGLIDVRGLVATSQAAADDTTDNVYYIKGMGFQSSYAMPVLPVIPRRTSPLIKVVAVVGAVLALAVIVVLSVFALTDEQKFDADAALAAESKAGIANPFAVAAPKTDLKSASKEAIDSLPDDHRDQEELASPSTHRPPRSASRSDSRHGKAAKRTSPSKAHSDATSKPQKLSRAEVQSGLGSVSAKVRRCGQGRASGIITVDVVINKNGKVGRVQPTGAHAHTAVGTCVASAVRTARFPEFTGPRITVKYPYRL